MSGGRASGNSRLYRMRRWSLALVGAAAAALIGYQVAGRYAPAGDPTERGSAKGPTLLPAGSDDGYIDAAACANCHQEVGETYRHTGMGRSLARPRAEAMIEDFTTANTFYHEPSDQHYTIHEKGGRYYQRRHQRGPGGEEINIVEKEIHFVVGSGNHARTYLHRTPDGRLFELPAAWYSEKGGYWAMNPGYDYPNHFGFRRQITQECLFCHSGYPEIEPGSDRVGSESRFPGRIPEGIDCQRCHGPGRAHLEAVGRGDPEEIRRSILNPSKLSSKAQLELCMQCHLETTSFKLPHSILRLDRGAFSYRPGQPLADYVLHFDHAPGTGHDDKFEIAHQAYRLRKSACFKASNGQLTCTTCHDAHDAPRGEAAVARYTAVCRQCHGPALRARIAQGRHSSAENCLECHMPKRRTDDVIHVAMTDHYIQRNKPARDLLAPLKERHDTEETAYQGPVTAYYPEELPPGAGNELYLAMAQIKQFSNLKEGIPRMARALDQYRPARGEFYFELAEAHAHLNQLEQAVAYYEQATSRSPDFRPAWVGLGRALSKLGRHEPARIALAKALELNPNDANVLSDLGLMQLRQGKLSEAVAALRRAISSDPDYPEAHGNLGGALSQSGELAGAEASYREAIRLQPDFAGAHRNLANLLAARGDLPNAAYHFRKAIYHDPRYAEAHQDYGLALAAMERYGEARSQFEAAVRLNPDLAAAQGGLADMLALDGLTARAIQHYERALAIDPAMGPARLGLGSALASQGNLAEAISHLERAAQSSDAPVRQTAREALQAIQRERPPL